MSDLSMFTPVYPALAVVALEGAAAAITQDHRNDKASGALTVTLRRAAAKTLEGYGLVSDGHTQAVTDQLYAWVYDLAPADLITHGDAYPGSEAADPASRKDHRRRWIIDLIGDSPAVLVAAWLKDIARQHPRA